MPWDPTCFDGTVNMGFGLVVDPVESGFHRKSGERAVFALVSVRRGDIHCPSLVVERLHGMVSVLIPTLCHAQLYPGPLVHDGDGQRVQLVFTSLLENKMSH